MKNVLIVVANPKEESFSFAIANKYKTRCEENNCNVEILDLYRDENQQPFYTKERSTTKEMKYYQEKISKADEITFIFPYWWGSMPAILKNFFDWNISSGFAFKYVNSKPVGLLKGKNVKVFTTTGTPYFTYMFTGAHRRLRNMFKEQIIEFCGMKLEEFNIFGGIDTSKKNMQKILDSM